MKNLTLIFLAAIAVVGCSGTDTGAAIPTTPPKMTAEQIQSMPPEAQRSMANAQKSGDYQAQRMAEMAAAQRAAGK